jgi:hypothetical protein
MFALSERDLEGSILDCAAGPSSFNAEMRARGGRVVSVDPIYEFSADQIRSRVEAVRDTMIDQVRRQPRQFTWEIIRSPEHLEAMRLGAMNLFLDDFVTDAARQRYRPQSLPKLDLPDKGFDLALCSHFLFLYSDWLDEQFHIDALRELLRVGREVRVFPITDLSGKQSPHLARVMHEFNAETASVPYEFLRGANQMLVARASRK